MIFKEIFCAIPINSDPTKKIEEDILKTLLDDTKIIYSKSLDEIIDNIKNHHAFEITDRPIKVKVTIEINNQIKSSFI